MIVKTFLSGDCNKSFAKELNGLSFLNMFSGKNTIMVYFDKKSYFPSL